MSSCDILLANLNINYMGFLYEKMGAKVSENFTVGFNSIQLICEGNGWIQVDGKMYYPEKGHICLLPANIVQSYGPIGDKHIKKYFCHFYADADGQNLFDLIDFEASVMVNDYNRALKIFYELERIHEKDDLLSTLRKKQLILELICLLLESHDKTPNIRRHEDNITIKIIDYINSNLSKNISVTELAALFGYNTNYFTSLFKSFTNMTPKTYIINAKLKKAVALLYDMNLSIAEIADQTGFVNQYYFSTSFKKNYGLSPSQYRDMYIKNAD